jgi:hypothetical protein
MVWPQAFVPIEDGEHEVKVFDVIHGLVLVCLFMSRTTFLHEKVRLHYDAFLQKCVLLNVLFGIAPKRNQIPIMVFVSFLAKTLQNLYRD